MIGSEQRMTTNDDRSRAVQARDAALARIRRTRRWVIAGAAALTAGFAALVAAVAPGKSLAPKSPVQTEASTGSSSARTASSTIPELPPAANPDTLGLQGSSSQSQSGPSQAQSSAPTQPTQPAQPTPPASPPQSSPAPQSSGGGGVVSGGS
jgi:hypothetical protein